MKQIGSLGRLINLGCLQSSKWPNVATIISSPLLAVMHLCLVHLGPFAEGEVFGFSASLTNLVGYFYEYGSLV